MVAMMATSMITMPNTLVDGAWYMDLGVSHHLTLYISNLSHFIPYRGFKQVMVGNGKGISILNLGNISTPSTSRFLHLKHELHTPKISKKLINVNHLCTINNAFIEFHPIFVLVNDQLSKKNVNVRTS